MASFGWIIIAFHCITSVHPHYITYLPLLHFPFLTCSLIETSLISSLITINHVTSEVDGHNASSQDRYRTTFTLHFISVSACASAFCSYPSNCCHGLVWLAIMKGRSALFCSARLASVSLCCVGVAQHTALLIHIHTLSHTHIHILSYPNHAPSFLPSSLPS